MLVFISHWFVKEERSRANTFLILGNPVTVLWMSVISGYLIVDPRNWTPDWRTVGLHYGYEKTILTRIQSPSR
jgi:hypothetical protein